MLDKILRDRPHVQFVRISNAAMLKMNQALGFKRYMAETTWQVETEKVATYLEQQNRK